MPEVLCFGAFWCGIEIAAQKDRIVATPDAGLGQDGLQLGDAQIHGTRQVGKVGVDHQDRVRRRLYYSKEGIAIAIFRQGRQADGGVSGDGAGTQDRQTRATLHPDRSQAASFFSYCEGLHLHAQATGQKPARMVPPILALEYFLAADDVGTQFAEALFEVIHALMIGAIAFPGIEGQ
jgi:hypothetical protein